MRVVPSDPRSIGDILVVDDNPANLQAIEAALGDMSARVVRAESGSEALRLLLARDFALILLDVKMPTMDGFETARMIRSRKRSRHTPIVFMTAYGRDDADVLAAYELGAVDFLFKPLMPEVLRAKASVFVELQLRSAEIAAQAQQIREHERREHERSLQVERERWEAETLRRQMEHLAQVDRHKDRFLALLSHELRNPLASVVTGLSVLRRRLSHSDVPEDRSIHHTCEVLERQTAHLTRLVDDLLDISRVSSGKVELRREDVSLQTIVERALQISEPLLREHDHALHIDLPSEPVMLHGDPIRLVQVLANLLNNAARYTPRGGQVRIAASISQDTVHLRVSDNGRGMAKDFLPHVFEAFCQEDQQAGSGLGLGLSVVRQLVALHDGTVAAHSAGPGQGSELTVRLPLAAHVTSEGAERTTAERAAAFRAPTPPKARPLSIVVIDDSDDLRDMTAELLRGWGHQVEVACDGKSGEALTLQCLPDIAFIDIGLPDRDGYEVASQLRARLGDRRIRLVAMTGFGQQADKDRAFAAGFDLHIVKPASLEALQNALAFKEP